MEDGLDTAGGYGELGNLSKVVEMKELSYEKNDYLYIFHKYYIDK